MKTIAIEGLDGSGKTSVAHGLQENLELEGMVASVVAPYRLANEVIGHDIYPCWKSTNGAQNIIKLMLGVLEEQAEKARDEKTDVLIYDRHWMTAFTEIGANDDLIAQWGDNFVPTAYLRVDAETARARAGNDEQADWMERHNFDNYAARYQKLCHTFGAHILGVYRNDNDVALSSIVSSIQWDMQVAR